MIIPMTYILDPNLIIRAAQIEKLKAHNSSMFPLYIPRSHTVSTACF